MDIIINTSQGGYVHRVSAKAESSVDMNPGQWGGRCVKACPQLTRAPGRLPGISSGGEIPECGDTQTALDRSAVNNKY